MAFFQPIPAGLTQVNQSGFPDDECYKDQQMLLVWEGACFCNGEVLLTITTGQDPHTHTHNSVADPDPYVFGPPGSGSVTDDVRIRIRIRILLSSSKNSKKNLDS